MACSLSNLLPRGQGLAQVRLPIGVHCMQQCCGSGSVESKRIPIISLDPDPYKKLAGSGIRIRINAMPIYLNNQILYCTYNMYCIQYSTEFLFCLDPDPYLFCLDPDPYQSSSWIRIHNEFFHILDPDSYKIKRICNTTVQYTVNHRSTGKRGPSVFTPSLVLVPLCYQSRLNNLCSLLAGCFILAKVVTGAEQGDTTHNPLNERIS